MPIRPSSPRRGPAAPIALAARHPRVAGAAGAAAIAFSGIFVRLADTTPTTAAVFRCAYAIPVLTLLALAERRRFGPMDRRSVRLSLLAGLLFGGDLVFWHTAIGFVGAGLATVLANAQVLLVGLLAWWLLGERPDPRVASAVPLVLTGVVLISGVGSAVPYGANPPLGVLFGLMTALAYASFFLVLRAGNVDRRRPAGPLLLATTGAMLCATTAGLVIGDLDVVPRWPTHGWLLLLALVSQVGGWLLISTSLPRLPALITAILLLLQPAGTVVLGTVLLGERPSLPQLAGVALVLGGVTAANLRRRRPVPAAADAPALPDARAP